MDDVMVAAAKALATAAHATQTDKAGRPYITHPQRVAARVAGDSRAEAAAWLHDVVEDSSITLADLAADGFDPEIIRAVDALTRRDGEPPEDYYARIRAVPLALRVKFADLADNTDPHRLAALDDATRERLIRKYAATQAALTGV